MLKLKIICVAAKASTLFSERWENFPDQDYYSGMEIICEHHNNVSFCESVSVWICVCWMFYAKENAVVWGDWRKFYWKSSICLRFHRNIPCDVASGVTSNMKYRTMERFWLTKWKLKISLCQMLNATDWKVFVEYYLHFVEICFANRLRCIPTLDDEFYQSQDFRRQITKQIITNLYVRESWEEYSLWFRVLSFEGWRPMEGEIVSFAGIGIDIEWICGLKVRVGDLLRMRKRSQRRFCEEKIRLNGLVCR